APERPASSCASGTVGRRRRFLHSRFRECAPTRGETRSEAARGPEPGGWSRSLRGLPCLAAGNRCPLPCSPPARKHLTNSSSGGRMARVRVLVGTRKGAFLITSDGARRSWTIDGPHFGGWEVMHLKASPVEPNRIYASQWTDWHG